MKVAIVAVEAVCAVGDTLDECWGAVCAGKTGIREVERFPVGNYVSSQAALVDSLGAPSGESLILPLVGKLRFEDINIPADARLYTSTTKAGVDGLEWAIRTGNIARKAVAFSHVLDAVHEQCQSGVKACNVSSACASSTMAIARAASGIKAGKFDSALVVAADVVTEFVFSGFSSLKALSPAPCKPFDASRDGLSLGEGAVVMLLMSREKALREGYKILGYVTGWGSANDATHVTAPARDGCGLVEATSLALKMARREPRQVGAIVAHGTGTVFNDAMELTAFAKVFPDARPPLVGFKGATGHTLGTAGALEATFSLKMILEELAPQTVGLVEPDELARGWITSQNARLARPCVLTTNSGFGGVNAALVIEGA